MARLAKKNIAKFENEDEVRRLMFLEYREENAKDMQREANL
jgi:hypothetical protein